MRKIIALALALVMVLALAACGGGNTPSSTTPSSTTPSTTPSTSSTSEPASSTPSQTTDPDAIPDTMTSSDGKYEIAFVTDVGQLKDKSFNQGTYDGVKLYAANNSLSYKYYQPANGDKATDDDRFDAMKAAADGGAKVVVCAGFMQGGALERAAKEFTNVNFVFIDGWDMGLDNVAGIVFKEEQPGFFAGYAAVKEGYEKLGFSGGGGGTNAAVNRYGYGFVQGANAAAAEMGKTVEIKYTYQYGASFSASPELQSMMSGWYQNGTEVVFGCGGSIFQSITAAASAADALVIGVDVDQSPESDTVITSAMKGLASATQWAIGKNYDGSWSEIANNGTGTSLGVKEDAVGLPVDTWSLKNFTVADYEALYQKVLNGSITIDDQAPEADGIAAKSYSNVNLMYE